MYATLFGVLMLMGLPLLACVAWLLYTANKQGGKTMHFGTSQHRLLDESDQEGSAPPVEDSNETE